MENLRILMNPSFDFQKISLTAKLAAYMRGLTDIPFAPEISRILHTQETFETLLAAHAMAPADLHWYAPIFEARYKSLAALLRRVGATQILELASGFSLRGLEMASDPRVRYLETDLDDLTEEKTHLVRALGVSVPPNLHFAAVNALEPEQLWAAGQIFRRDQPLAIVHEGLLPYLTASELETLAHNIHALLEAFGGVWITPDFAFKGAAQPVSEQQRKFRAIVAAATDRPMYAHTFEDAADLEAFLAGLGFRVEAFGQLDLAPDVVSVPRLGLSPQLLDDLRTHAKVWMMRSHPTN